MNLTVDGREGNGNSAYAEISADGRWVLFSSIATDLIPADDTTGFLDFFVRDRDSSDDGRFDEAGDVCTRRLSATPWGEGANGRSGGNTSISGDGVVVFMSRGSNLIPADTNGVKTSPSACSPACPFGQDIFLRTLD